MPSHDRARGRWRMLGLLAAAELLGMSAWFAATAVAPDLQARWALTAAEAGWLTSIVQLGFVVGTLGVAVLNVADVVPSRVLFAAAALVASAANAALLLAPGFAPALGLRFLTGLALAGVYPPAMKMASTWFRDGRGLAIGAVVGALTIGKATPYLVEASGLHGLGPVVLGTSAAVALAAALVAVGYRDGPHAFPRRAFSWGLVGSVVRERRVRLATLGYLGHMFELYCFWAWMPFFLAASVAARAGAGHAVPSAGAVHAIAFAAIAVGAVGCVVAGRVADRIGRERVVVGALAVSGTCAVLSAAAFGGPVWLLAGLACVWGVAVIADSAQFSAIVTEVAPAHAVGTALTLQTSLGFLLTIATIQMVPPIVGWLGWRWAFPALALGPVLGIAAIVRLRRLRAAA